MFPFTMSQVSADEQLLQTMRGPAAGWGAIVRFASDRLGQSTNARVVQAEERFKCRGRAPFRKFIESSIMATPLVRVVMTADNRENYLAEAVESVLASNFTDFELIIVGDGCYDRMRREARRLVEGRFGWRRLGKQINLIVAEDARPRTE
jgi:hypothetical protein